MGRSGRRIGHHTALADGLARSLCHLLGSTCAGGYAVIDVVIVEGLGGPRRRALLRLLLLLLLLRLPVHLRIPRLTLILLRAIAAVQRASELLKALRNAHSVFAVVLCLHRDLRQQQTCDEHEGHDARFAEHGFFLR